MDTSGEIGPPTDDVAVGEIDSARQGGPRRHEGRRRLVQARREAPQQPDGRRWRPRAIPERRAPSRHKTDVKEKDRKPHSHPRLEHDKPEGKTVVAPLLSTVEKIDSAAWIETLQRQAPNSGTYSAASTATRIQNRPSGTGTSTVATGRAG